MRHVCIVVVITGFEIVVFVLVTGKVESVLFYLAELKKVKSIKMLSMSKLCSEEDYSQELEDIE